ncbi:hypothetical protein E2C01_067261 [Portunus trituberculatus]|uniref:Uncharacterized protein n=1 Tax=Portunus trituberculatus TaxID=210409 RepID=A0A5B7HUJ7_PORTR|nr:hypothetical protein [Portunus trituberculatus]
MIRTLGSFSVVQRAWAGVWRASRCLATGESVHCMVCCATTPDHEAIQEMRSYISILYT